MRVIYISGPYRGDCENEVFEHIAQARSIAVKLWDMGYAVICPHTNSFFMGSRLGDSRFLEGDLEILRRCDSVIMVGDWEKSVGARWERNLALKLNIPIYYSLSEISNV